MDQITKRRALLAASKVTFSTMVTSLTAGAALFGAIACGDDEANVPVAERDGTQAGDTANASKKPEEKGPTTAATSTTRKSEPPPKQDPPPPPVVAACTDAACCNAKLAAVLTEEDGWAWEPEAHAALREKIGDQGVACCGVLIEASVQPPNYERSPHHWACCSVLSEPVGDDLLGACTPWGPPTPPSFDDDAFALALFAAVAPVEGAA